MISINRPKSSASRYGVRNRQFGVAMPLVVIAMVAMLAIAGLALDSSHAFVNKTRLQNMADVAALAAAKVYDDTADTIQGTAAANSVFGINTDGSGNFEIDGAYDAGDITVIVQWSTTLNPFTPSGIGPYVRVIATGFNMATGLSAVIGITTIDIRASAVAGPSPTIDNTVCNIAPLVVCANDINADYFGFIQADLMVLKPSPGVHGDVGPGNFKLLDLGCDDVGGGACVRNNMAGDYDACATANDTVETEPGVTAGPTSQGFNTRFGVYNGPISPGDYPPDLVVHQTSPPLDTYLDASDNDVITWGGQIVTNASNIDGYDYSDYLSRNTNPGQHDFLAPVGVKGRRVLTMPVADCTGDDNGQSTLEVKGFACYFMLQQIGGGTDKNIFGQFVDTCVASGAPGMDPGAGPGPYIIQLYKDPDSGDS
jgi:hypothetical protein